MAPLSFLHESVDKFKEELYSQIKHFLFGMNQPLFIHCIIKLSQEVMPFKLFSTPLPLSMDQGWSGQPWFYRGYSLLKIISTHCQSPLAK